MTQINLVNKISESIPVSEPIRVDDKKVLTEEKVKITEDKIEVPVKKVVSENPFNERLNQNNKDTIPDISNPDKKYPRIEVDMKGLLEFEPEMELSPDEEIKKYKSEPNQPKLIYDIKGILMEDDKVLYDTKKNTAIPDKIKVSKPEPSSPLKYEKLATPIPKNLNEIVTTTYSDMRGNKLKVRGDVVQPLNKLMEITSKRGIRVTVTYGYRSNAEQQRLWTNAIGKYGSASAARKWVAPPGRSRHNQGIALDVTMHKNGRKLGQAEFDQIIKQAGFYRPMSWEGWHIEPISTRR